MSGRLSVSLRQGPPAQGELWYLKSRLEANIPVDLEVGNFSAVTLQPEPKDASGGGQTCWVMLGQAEIDWIKSLNTDPTYLNWSGACKPINGGMYKTVDGVDPKDARSIYWFRIALHSPDGVPLKQRNKVMVLEYANNYCRIASIPKSLDYRQYEELDYLIPKAYTIYTDLHTGTMAIYRMPLFNPGSGFRVSTGHTELWLHTKWLYSRVDA